MAADGMDKKGPNGPDSASEELFNFSRSTGEDERVDGKEPGEVDPPASSGAGSQEIVDLPNIHFGSSIDGLDAGADQEATSSRLTDTTAPPARANQGPADDRPSFLPDGRLGHPAPITNDVPVDQPADPSKFDGEPGLGRGTTVIRPIGPIAVSPMLTLSLESSRCESPHDRRSHDKLVCTARPGLS